ncbi:uncharacterized protein LOC113212989 [Frankliniella occidentalis]|uniref:Uncharacterized protein LOC113212989 n=1 Tax=Frankliniella occidentalis TaxID=133901 RepID=A0A6J1TAA9_FRAOC|nr:uncharacterized protein LOC113212989 [Frankliniella occidentalis]
MTCNETTPHRRLRVEKAMWWLPLAAALLMAAEAVATVTAAATADGKVLPAARASTDAGDSTESFLSMASCAAQKDAMRCLEQRASRYRSQLLDERRAWDSRALQDSDADADTAVKATEAILDGLVPDVPGEDAMEAKDAVAGHNSRGHKLKKKIHKIIKIIKIIIFIVVVKLKMVFAMLMMQTLFQFKLVAITFMILLIKKYYLWVEWKHKKEEKKAVVYYEHAQHQHHYDETDHFHDGLGGLLGGQHGYDKHADPSGAGAGGGAEAAGGWGGWWGKRSAEFPTPQVPVVAAAANLGAQQMAYNAYRPAQAAAQMVG